MVAAEQGSIHNASGNAAVAARRRGQQLAVALVAMACVVTLAAGELRERKEAPSVLLQTSKLDIAGKKESYDGISTGLIGSLEKAMDVSIDNKVDAFLSAPEIGSIPVPGIGPVHAGGGRGAFVPADYAAEYSEKKATHNYLAKLSAQKRQLEREKAKLMADLRARHRAAQTEAVKDSIEYNEEHLERAQEIAKMRLAQQAQQAARQMAKKMREATIAKQTYIHAQAVAEQRIHDLNMMVHNTDSYGSFIAKPKASPGQQLSAAVAVPAVNAAAAAKPEAVAKRAAVQYTAEAKPAPAAAGTVQEGSDKNGASAVSKDVTKGTKLYHYLQEQKELEVKIKAAERAAKKHKISAVKKAGEPSHNSKVQTAFIRTIAKALSENKEAIKKDEGAASHLKMKQEALFASMKALKRSDELLFQKVKTEDSQVG